MRVKETGKKWCFILAILLVVIGANMLPGQFTGFSGHTFAATDPSQYYNRFITLFNNLQNSGYLSTEGVPYHSVETLMVEAPDYGHLTTSEAFSYLTWLGATYGKITGDWSYYEAAWDKAEKYIIPASTDVPGLSTYNSSSPATYAPEADLPSDFPVTGDSSAPTGIDPIASELKTAYGSDRFYQMHWLLDVDNWYGYGNHGDGTSRCSYINTFQRGPQESVWETVTHPSWESFTWGAGSSGGFLPLFGKFGSYAKQWRYTSASDADARQVQASYWAYLWAKEQGKESNLATYTAKAAKMGDYLRYTMFDKYFRPIGVQAATTAGTGYDSCHYLLSWYTSWGGAVDSTWSWRIGCSHVHQGYQNPVAAYALSNESAFAPLSTNGKSDWAKSLKRQIALYQYLQSYEGAIAGGVTNSYNGRYEAYPSGSSTFYNMIYDWEPVYHDPPSNRWFGMQAWAMERVMEYYYLTGDSNIKSLVDKWATWAIGKTTFDDTDGSYMIPNELTWSGQPDTWTGTATDNTSLHCTVSTYTNDVGVAAGFAKALIYYAAAYAKYNGGVQTTAKETAAKLLDRMWTLYRDTIGVACSETRSDYSRFFDTVYIPTSYSGTNAQGATLKNGMTFIDMRPLYKKDSSYQTVLDAHNNGTTPTFKYHRFWAQADIAMANAMYYIYLSGTTPTSTPTPTPTGTVTTTPTPTITITPTPTPVSGNYLVTYTVQSDWGSGASVNVTITNNSSSAISSWTLAWAFPNSQKISNLWNGSYTQSGTSVSVTNLTYNGNIAANGGTVSFGFNLTYSGTNSKPTSFTLNGASCTVH
jgi:endoglucanase